MYFPFSDTVYLILNQWGFSLNTKRKIMRQINIKFVEVQQLKIYDMLKGIKRLKFVLWCTQKFPQLDQILEMFLWKCRLFFSYTIESLALVTCMWIMTNFTSKALCNVRIYISSRKVFGENENHQSRNCIIFSITGCVRRP